MKALRYDKFILLNHDMLFMERKWVLMFIFIFIHSFLIPYQPINSLPGLRFEQGCKLQGLISKTRDFLLSRKMSAIEPVTFWYFRVIRVLKIFGISSIF